MRKGTFWRENKVDCGSQWRAVEIFKYSDSRTSAVRKQRKKKCMLSTPAQKNLNDRRAVRYFQQLVLANFQEGDYVCHLTYSDKYLPADEAEAMKWVRRWLDRISYELKKRELPALKYICVTAKGDIHGRLHHHVFLSCALERNEIEDMWWAVKGSKNKPREMLGGINVDRLKNWSGNGIFEMAKYVSRQAKGKKKWTQSQNLKRPVQKRANDSKYRSGTMEKIVTLDEKSPEMYAFIQKNYPDYDPVQIEIVEPKTEYCWGGGVYLLLHKRERTDKNDKLSGN